MAPEFFKPLFLDFRCSCNPPFGAERQRPDDEKDRASLTLCRWATDSVMEAIQLISAVAMPIMNPQPNTLDRLGLFFMFGFKQVLQALAMGPDELFGSDDARIGKIAPAMPETTQPADFKVIPAFLFNKSK